MFKFMMSSWLKPLLSIQYWTNSHSPAFEPGIFKIVALIIIGLVVIGVAVRLVGSKQEWARYKKLIRRISNLLVTVGILFGVALFFTQTETPVLGARWWWLVWLVTGMVWGVLIIKYAWRKLPREVEEQKARAQFEKYLPKRTV